MGTIRNIADLKKLTKVRVLMMSLPRKIKPPWKKEVLASTSTHSDHDVWLFDSSASFHMTTDGEWFCEYEK